MNNSLFSGKDNKDQEKKNNQKNMNQFNSSELASTSPNEKGSDKMKMTKQEMLEAFEGKNQVNKLRKPQNCPMEKDKPCACLLQNISPRDCPFGKKKQSHRMSPSSPKTKKVCTFFFFITQLIYHSLKNRPKSFPVVKQNPEGERTIEGKGNPGNQREQILRMLENMRLIGMANSHKQMPGGKEKVQSNDEKKDKFDQWKEYPGKGH